MMITASFFLVTGCAKKTASMTTPATNDVQSEAEPKPDSPLVNAALHGSTADIDRLVSEGKDVNEIDENGSIPLLEASIRGNSETVAALLRHGANVNAVGKDGSTALLLAARNSNAKTAEILLDNGADMNIKEPDDGNFPLHEACLYHNLAVVKALLERGADVNARNNDGYTPLHYSGWVLGSNDWAPADGTSMPDDGVRAEVARFLLEHGADANATTNSGHRPLEVAQFYKHVLVATVIQQYGGK